jgi:hypothetical protein
MTTAADVARENIMRWNGGPGHYEVWYATLAHPSTETGFWIRYTMESPLPGHGEPYAQLWFARFDGRDPRRTFGINQKRPIGELVATSEPFSVRIGANELTGGSARGALRGGGHEVSWDLRWRPSERLHRMFMSLAYKGTWAPTQAVTPNQNVAAEGEIVVDGERYVLEGAPLGQTHLWGRKHGYAWAWSHCNAFEGDRGASLETITARIRRGPIVLPPLTLITLYLDGDEPSVWDLREPWALPFTRSTYGTGRYHLRGESLAGRVEIEMTCRPEDMLLTEYVDPDGEAAFCHNTECADARVEVWKRSPFVGRLRKHRTLIARKTAHYEWGARAGDPLVKKRHVTV